MSPRKATLAMLEHGWDAVLRGIEAAYASTVVLANSPQPEFLQPWVQAGLVNSDS